MYVRIKLKDESIDKYYLNLKSIYVDDNGGIY